MEKEKNWPSLVFITFAIVVVGFGAYKYQDLSSRYFGALGQFASSTEEINQLKSLLGQNQKVNADLTNSLNLEKQRNDQIAGQVSEITSTVGTLKKLSQTDRELLQKYSKIYFLSENYAPTNLATITPAYLFNKKRPELILSGVWPHLESMIRDASSTAVDLKIVSAYRSFDEQSKVKSKYLITYGSGANKFSADQGYSEHQLGTTVDIAEDSEVLTVDFEKTKAYRWLVANAYKYGFVISYPRQNTYYQFEPWHWRFVGIQLATKLHNDNKYFFNTAQRELSPYLVNIFD